MDGLISISHFDSGRAHNKDLGVNSVKYGNNENNILIKQG